MTGVTVIPQPYLLFLGAVREPTYAKTASGLRDWAAEKFLGSIRLRNLP